MSTPTRSGASGLVNSSHFLPPTGATFVYRKLRLCSNGGGIEAVPDGALHLDLERIRTLLAGRGIPVVDARVMLIVSLDPEVTISKAGRLLFKTPDHAAAKRAFDRLRGWVELPPLESG